MSSEIEQLRQQVSDLQQEVDSLKRLTPAYRCVRRRAETGMFGLPWYEVALGPNPELGERRGHARAIVAIGDMATGVIAIGGMARGVVALGGLAMGLFTFGGCSIGLLAAVGGLAVGGLAIGGCAIGLVAIGGAAIGYYAIGGGAIGQYVMTDDRQDPQAVQFFQQFGITIPLHKR